ncbi:RHS repeat-associated core domain-containing protein, partial [Streptomyces chartreusis]
VRLYDPATGRFLSTDPILGGNANAYDYVQADPLNRYDLDGRRGWWKRAKGWWGRKSRNPNYRHWYYGARVVGSLINPARKIRYVGRFVRNPRRVYRMCSRSWRNAAGCGLTFWGVSSAYRHGRNMQRNYRYMRAYNTALTYDSRRRICRHYTGYRGRGSCT